jgi:hypothetical protein
LFIKRRRALGACFLHEFNPPAAPSVINARRRARRRDVSLHITFLNAAQKRRLKNRVVQKLQFSQAESRLILITKPRLGLVNFRLKNSKMRNILRGLQAWAPQVSR